MGDREFRAFLDLMMCSDPNPAGEEVDAILKRWADEESQRHGFDNWIVAFHELKPTPEAPR